MNKVKASFCCWGWSCPCAAADNSPYLQGKGGCSSGHQASTNLHIYPIRVSNRYIVYSMGTYLASQIGQFMPLEKEEAGNLWNWTFVVT